MDMLQFVYPFIYWWAFGSFQFLTVINKTFVNLNTQVFIWTFLFFPLDIPLEVEWLDHTVIVCLSFKEIVTLFAKVVVPFYISTSTVWTFQLLTIMNFSSHREYMGIFSCKAKAPLGNYQAPATPPRITLLAVWGASSQTFSCAFIYINKYHRKHIVLFCGDPLYKNGKHLPLYISSLCLPPPAYNLFPASTLPLDRTLPQLR